MDTVGRVAAIGGGALLALWVLGSAIRTVVLPRGDPVALTRALFLAMRKLFDLRVRGSHDYEERDRRMALYAPVSLVLLPGVWVALTVLSFTAVFWGMGVDPLSRAFELAGSSMLTLGFVAADSVPQYVVAFAAATLGLGLVALLISYLPSIYASFQRRELQIARLATRAGEPPSPITMIVRHHLLARLDALDDVWDEWESWFADVEETHTSQPSLVFFRSISHERSWITAAGVVLDTAAFRASTLRLPREPRAELCLRAGYLSLRRIAGYFGIPFDDDPNPDDPISVAKDEFLAAYEELASQGVPVRPNREQCWRDFAGWRVNYDVPLIALAALTMAPYAPWSSDRSMARWRPKIVQSRRK